ncbi:MAG: terminase [Bacilli bacterium]
MLGATQAQTRQAPPNPLPASLSSAPGLGDTLGSRTWRLNNLYWITTKEGRVIPFRLNWAQEALLDQLHKRNVILKARQLGYTTFIDLFILDAALFNKNLRCGIIAHHRDDARVIFRDKIQFAYNNLGRHPLGQLVKQTVTADQSTAMELTFSNGSNIRVSTSFRSGTLQMLHVSEYAKLCARYPAKAQEIRTGALNAVAKGQLIFVESTAEGRSGHFYELCTEAAKREALGQKLTDLDFKRHFAPWWKHPEYVLDPAGVVISQELQGYFKDLEIGHGIYLTDAQKAWYSKMKDTQRDEMFREYPSTEEEAFLAAIVGAYYGTHMAKVRKERRICGVPYDPRFPVNTAWDLGVGDMMTILFHQKIGGEHHLIDAYKNHGEGLAHYVRILQERKYVYGNHYLPHDIEARELGTGTSRLEVLRGLMPGANLVVVPRLDIPDGIEAVRNILGACWFDQAKTDEILVKALESYQREWDEDLGVFKAKPLHDHNSHPADAMRYLATGLGYYPAAAGPIGVKGPTAKWKRRKRSAMVV